MKYLFSLLAGFLVNIQNVFADAAAVPAAPNPLTSLVPFLLIFAIFYFLMIRPQKKRLQEEQAMLGALAKGDEVVTKSGFLGTVAGLTEKIVTLEIAEGLKIKVLRGQIAGPAKKVLAEGTSEEKSK